MIIYIIMIIMIIYNFLSPVRFQVIIKKNPCRPTQSLGVRLSSSVGDPLQHLKKNICFICVADYVYMTR